MRFILIFIFLWSCQQEQAKIHEISGETMGTYYSLKFAGIEDSLLSGVKSKVEQRLESINKVFSTYMEDSEISKVNRAKAKVPIALSEEMGLLLELSKEIHSQTDGYFDVTVGPIVNAWGFGPDGKRKRPTENELKKLKEVTGMNKLGMPNARTLVKKFNETYIDMSAIAKGHGVDKLLELLISEGAQSALVEIGGEVRTLGLKPGGSPWLVGIEKPSQKLGGAGLQEVVALKNMAMATSGSYRNFVRFGDQVFSHAIDPQTGRPSLSDVISVTVMAPKCATADANATAFMSMGSEKGLKMAKKLGLPAYFIVKKGDESAILMTDSFKPFLQK